MKILEERLVECRVVGAGVQALSLLRQDRGVRVECLVRDLVCVIYCFVSSLSLLTSSSFFFFFFLFLFLFLLLLLQGVLFVSALSSIIRNQQKLKVALENVMRRRQSSMPREERIRMIQRLRSKMYSSETSSRMANARPSRKGGSTTMAAKNPFQKGISLKDQKNERWLGLTRSNRETSSTFPVSSTILYLSLLCSSLHI